VLGRPAAYVFSTWNLPTRWGRIGGVWRVP